MGAKLGGGGGKKWDLGQNSEINVTPFVDVMLVLLIIFMVAAPMATVSIAIDLPPAIPPPPSEKKPPDPTIVFIQDTGALFIDGVQTRLENLPADIPADMTKKGVTGVPQEERVFLQAQPDVTYDKFMEVLNILQENGYFKVGIINEEIE
ncbi:biopolymer transporter ExbD [Caulobacter sp. SLTY]|uniref:biopolymer transporter ExbD n=1 Tax=Caulobacter sp. SLTY TaxID=2683262 RepID=UPI00141333D8|nr:biopolymer transporter ExbD [Caulobacter sp. SLTY]NBB16746.1 biopolymer transporter ExbD [Caulobacter sp. SLTY]NBB16754.1 biopolymer transporter ExbD [Caulobacter sp. SLTY]